ncbi:MAG: NAD(P)H-dependent oxidoreductase [Muricomes sp.]
MKIVLIHGQNHKGSTYNIGRMLAEKIGEDITEFFLPRDFGEFCIGCTKCFMVGESKCPHYDKLTPITEAMNEADVLILASPVYVFHATGPMKTLLDHYGYRWMVHRPEGRMFQKQGVCISTAAGGGMKSANKDMADSLFFWGIPKIYKYGQAVYEISYEGVSDKIKNKIDHKTTAMAEKIKRNHGKVKPGIKTRVWFFILHLVQRKGMLETDRAHWVERGWTGKVRPWKQQKGEGVLPGGN